MKDNNTKDRFIEFRAAGWSYIRISKELDVCKQTLINWSKELENEISNFRALELDALQEKSNLSKQKRIGRFGIQQQAIDKKLANRDLSEVPTEKLHDLALKYGKFLKEEEVEVEFKQEQGPLEIDFSKNVTWKG